MSRRACSKNLWWLMTLTTVAACGGSPPDNAAPRTSALTFSTSGTLMPFGGQYGTYVGVVGSSLQVVDINASGRTFVINGPTIQTTSNPPLCIDLQYGDLAAGVVGVAGCNGSINQQWFVSGGQIVSANRGDGQDHCLDVRYGDPALGTPLGVPPCNGTAAQVFWPAGFTMKIPSTFSVTSGPSSVPQPECLDVLYDNEAVGASLDDSVCNGGNAQWFILDNNKHIALANSPGLCLATGPVSAGVAQVSLQACTPGDTRQQWSFVNNGLVENRRVASINNVASACLDILNANPASPTPVVNFTCNGEVAQRWQPVTSSGSPYVAPACTSNGQCPSGFCANGVCCNSACTNSCSACNLPGSIGTCSPKTNGSGCDDGNLCTQLDTCQAGSCVGGDAKVCPPADQCRPSATCSPSTGLCPVAAANTSCSDGNVCNGDETCDGQGACKAGTPLTCVASAGCVNPSTCHPTNGCQAGPARPGQTCTTTNACATPGVCANPFPSDVADPTPDMEDYCARQRAVPVRFMEYLSETGESKLTSSYVQGAVQDLNEAFAKACMSFYPRQPFTIREPNFDRKFSNFSSTFDWSTADRDKWYLGSLHNPRCNYNVPDEGIQESGHAVEMVFQACGLPDEIIIWYSESKQDGGGSSYPQRHVYVPPGVSKAHEVGHDSSLTHPFDGVWPKLNPPSFDLIFQTQADYWDLYYAAGTPSTFNRFFANYDEAFAADQAGELSRTIIGGFETLGIYLPGTFIDPSDSASFTFVAPPKAGPGTGGGSCEFPPDGGPACASPARVIKDDPNTGGIWVDDGSLYCYYCEFRRMYEAWNGQDTFPPPGGKALGLLYAPGQSMMSWRSTGGVFQPGFAGFEVEKGDGRNGPVIAGLAPLRTKVETTRDPNRSTLNVMSYGVGIYPPGPDGMRSEGFKTRRLRFEAFSDSQAVLIRNGLKADAKMDLVDNTVDMFNPGKFTNYPARGSWEKIGQHLDTSGPPSIVGTSDGVLIAARTDTGDVVFRRWRYGDAPWTSQSGGTTLINGPAWKRVLPTQTSSAQGVISGTYRAADGVFDIAMRNSNATNSWTEIAGVSDTGTGMRGWEHMIGDLRGSPVLVNHQGSEGARTSLFVLGGGPNPNDYIYINQWRRTEPEWTGWLAFDPLPSPLVVDGLEVVARPTGDVDLSVLTEDGRHHFAFMNVNLGATGWLDLGNPNPTAPPGKRLSIASFLNTRTVTPFMQIDVVAIDGNGATYHKKWTEVEGWTPSETAWNVLGETYHGRPRVSHNGSGDTDVVALDTTNGTVRFRRYRELLGVWDDDWFNLGGEGVTEPIAVARPDLPDVVDIFIVKQDGSLWHRPYVVPPHDADPLKQHYDIDYDYYCGCGFVTNATAKLPRARLGTSSCPCSR